MDKVFIKKNELSEWTQKYFKKDLISVDDLIRVIEDLDNELDRVKEGFDDYKQMIEDNYEPINPNKMYGVNESDFH